MVCRKCSVITDYFLVRSTRELNVESVIVLECKSSYYVLFLPYLSLIRIHMYHDVFDLRICLLQKIVDILCNCM